jgi:glutaredoxin 3
MKQSVTVYTTTLCPVCRMVKDFLDSMNVTYKEINIDMNPIAMIKLIGKTRKFTVPQTNINGTWISGFDPVKVLQVLGE